nr:1430_t:CDS:2 [Entrophospora candida]
MTGITVLIRMGVSPINTQHLIIQLSKYSDSDSMPNFLFTYIFNKYSPDTS